LRNIASIETFTMSSIYEFAAHDIFSKLPSPDSVVSMSFFEIQGDHCFDIMNEFEPTQLMTGTDGGVHAFPIIEPQVHSADDLIAMITHGRSVRSTASTGVNDTSSRSHAILRIYINRDVDAMGGQGEGVLTLVDLAGSEHKIDSMYHGAERRKEGAAINASLMALKECVRARASGHNVGHHYRKNKLTMALKSSFTLPLARTVIIGTVSPASKDTEHSLNTLRHACIMDGQDAHDEKETRFVTGGVKHIEALGEINVSGIARRRRDLAKAGNIEDLEPMVSNGNECKPDERILTDKEKRRIRRAAEVKAFSKLTSKQRNILQAARDTLGRGAVQEARFSRPSVDGNVPAKISPLRPSLNLPENFITAINGMDQKLSDLHAPREKLGDLSRVQSQSDLQPSRRLATSPITRVRSNDQRNDRDDASRVSTIPSKETINLYLKVRSGLIANEPNGVAELSDMMKRRAKTLLEQKNISIDDIKYLLKSDVNNLIAQVAVVPKRRPEPEVRESQSRDARKSIGGEANRPSESRSRSETDGISRKLDALSIDAAPPSKGKQVALSAEKVRLFRKLKNIVYSAEGVPQDILNRQLVALMKQKEFSGAEIKHLMQTLGTSLTDGVTMAADSSSSPAETSSKISQSSVKVVDEGKPAVLRSSKRAMLGVIKAPAEGSDGPRSAPAQTIDIPMSEYSSYEGIRELEVELANPSLSEAVRFAVKKKLAARKAEIVRAQRKRDQEERERMKLQQEMLKSKQQQQKEQAEANAAAASAKLLQDKRAKKLEAVLDIGPKSSYEEPERPKSASRPSSRGRSAGKGSALRSSGSKLTVEPEPLATSSTALPTAVARRKSEKTAIADVSDISEPPHRGSSVVREPQQPSVPDRKRRNDRGSFGGVSEVGALAAPFANEMNWNIYIE
jgi:hypothetical protein